MRKGNISVQTENIFPIIKKFLYSDHEIFLRELISNAVDATQKLKTLSSLGEAKGELGELAIEIKMDKEAKTITISDKGIGMTGEEVEKYINQVAFSGAEEFVNKYKGQNENAIIGKFGLGFYSAFMVSDRVEIQTKSFKDGAVAVRWECDGSPEYTLEETAKEDRGTDIIMHVNDESAEFLDNARISSILNKFCRFLPVAIKFEGEQINNPQPAWTKKALGSVGPASETARITFFRKASSVSQRKTAFPSPSDFPIFPVPSSPGTFTNCSPKLYATGSGKYSTLYIRLKRFPN